MKTFDYCREQLIFLSRKVLHHFDSSILPFEIKIDDFKNPNQVTINELISSFLLLDSLLHSNEQIEINETNVNSLSLLGNILDNPYLLSKCEKAYPEHPQSFSFNFKQLQFISEEERESFNNIKIIINDSIFDANRILFSVLSDRFNEINSNEISFSIPQADISCFLSFFNAMKGNPINFNKFKIDSLLSIIGYLNCHSIYSFISKLISIPQTLPESIKFLQVISIIDDSSPLKNHLNQSIKLLSSQFKEISFEDLNSFSLSVLKSIFSSEHLQIPNENYLFSTISHLIEENSNRKCLYQFILFPNVSINLLKEQFSKLKVEDIDPYLLEMFKSRLFFDYKADKIDYFPNRYSDFKEIEIINHEGIISFMKKESPNSVLIETSSSYNASSYPIENLFVYDSSTFGTQNSSNSSITFTFHGKKISVSKYFIRSVGSGIFTQDTLKNWILEGSNDKSRWTLIDYKINETSLNQDDSEFTFQCQPSQPFSYVKLTQVGKNQYGSEQLALSFIEFSGTIFLKQV
jgi:hypothetical protein